MRLSVTTTEDRYPGIQQFGCILSWGVLVILMFAGCQTISPHEGDSALSESGEQQVFDLEHIAREQCTAYLSQLDLREVSPVPMAYAVSVTGSPEQLRRAGIVLDLIDVKEEFVVENLGPASMVRTLPSNSQIAAALGNIRIGTFTDPPQADEQARGIIDIQGSSVIAILPARHREQFLNLLTRLTGETAPICPTLASREYHEPNHVEDASETFTEVESSQPKTKTLTQEVISPDAHEVLMSGEGNPHKELGPQEPYQRARPEPSFQGEKTLSPDSSAKERTAIAPSLTGDEGGVGVPRTLRIVLEPSKDTTESVATTAVSGSVEFQNGEDILDLDLPETMTLMQLLALVGEYLDLDYVYDLQTIGKQSVALKLHGSLQGEMKVKDLYILLETVLKFKSLAMIRGEDKLVTIVPVAQALDADPQLVEFNSRTVQAGDIVVTRVFELQYVDVASVTNLLQNMKLGVAVSTSEQAQILFVTCYAHRMSRIEQLVSMLDRPGRLRECRFRRLQYTLAPALANKIRTLAQELQSIPVTIVSATSKSSSRQGKGSGGSRAAGFGQPVYLDTDERTNRILMVGHEEQLVLLENLVDALDVVQNDLRTPKAYNIKHMMAQEALEKLQEMEVLGPSTMSTGRARMGASGTSSARTGRMDSDVLTEEPVVAVLEATNQLLVKATQEQHSQVSEFLGHIDISPEDLRTLQVYEIQYVDAEEVKNKLEELDIIGIGPTTSSRITTRPTKPGTTRVPSTDTTNTAEVLVGKPQIVVTESTNSLLVNATAEQHAQLATIINYVDSKMPEEEIPYKIYPLENSSPGHVADLLEQLIGETGKDKEGKIEKAIKREEQITIVPDPNTFSLIVYASRKNQEWIENLIKSLDKRRPQVLIDVTLVEITRTDTFEYDLNLVASAKEAVIDNIGIDPIHKIDSKSRLEGGFNLLDQEGNPTGQTKAFYSDEKVQALLTAIARKNYGRVLAKPKILVDDGQEGEISTTDETTYLKESVQVPDQGAPITTRDFEPIEAKIQLQITPHISEGDLLRLDVHLSREDFGTRPEEGAPPDKATSEVTTTVFVPDDHTVILGGLVKLNQSKGGSKVPILGDIPLVGALFRSVDNSDVEKKLYVFLKANTVRPYEEARLVDLQKISEEHRKAFEESEAEFQKYEDFPGITPEPMRPERVLEEL
jgi:type II secretory pathway component GspD/PulD (secretin)